MDKKNPIDQWLKQSFEQTPPGDKEALWAKVSASLDNKKKKHFGMWWLFGTAAVIAALALLYTNLNSNRLHEGETTIVEQEVQTDASDPSTNAKDPQTTDIAQNEISHDSDNINTTNSENSGKPNDAANEDKGRIDNAVKGKEKEEETTPNSVNFNSPEPKKNIELPEPVKMDGSNSPTNTIATEWFVKPMQPKIATSSLNYNLPNPLAITPFDIRSYDKKDPTKTIVLNNPWTIGINAGFSPTHEKISIANNGLPYVHKSYLNLREQGEKMMFNAQLELYFRKNIGNFFVQTGFSQLNRGFIQNYQYEINEIPITSALGGNTADANGRFPLDDQTPYLIDLTPEKISYQGKRTSSFIEIPLNMGYTFNTGKLLISPSIGAGINFTQQSGGTTIDYQYLTLIPHQNIFKINNTGYSFNSSVMVEYPLGKNIFLQAQPFYHRFLKSNTDVINQKPISYGLNIGLNLKLQNNE